MTHRRAVYERVLCVVQHQQAGAPRLQSIYSPPHAVAQSGNRLARERQCLLLWTKHSWGPGCSGCAQAERGDRLARERQRLLLYICVSMCACVCVVWGAARWSGLSKFRCRREAMAICARPTPHPTPRPLPPLPASTAPPAVWPAPSCRPLRCWSGLQKTRCRQPARPAISGGPPQRWPALSYPRLCHFFRGVGEVYSFNGGQIRVRIWAVGHGEGQRRLGAGCCAYLGFLRC